MMLLKQKREKEQVFEIALSTAAVIFQNQATESKVVRRNNYVESNIIFRIEFQNH